MAAWAGASRNSGQWHQGVWWGQELSRQLNWINVYPNPDLILSWDRLLLGSATRGFPPDLSLWLVPLTCLPAAPQRAQAIHHLSPRCNCPHTSVPQGPSTALPSLLAFPVSELHIPAVSTMARQSPPATVPSQNDSAWFP